MLNFPLKHFIKLENYITSHNFFLFPDSYFLYLNPTYQQYGIRLYVNSHVHIMIKSNKEHRVNKQATRIFSVFEIMCLY